MGLRNIEIFGDEYKRKYCRHCKTYEDVPFQISKVERLETIHALKGDDFESDLYMYNYFGYEGYRPIGLCGFNGSNLKDDDITIISKTTRPLRFVTCKRCISIYKKQDGKDGT